MLGMLEQRDNLARSARHSVGHEPARDEPRGKLEPARLVRGAGSARLLFDKQGSSPTGKYERKFVKVRISSLL